MKSVFYKVACLALGMLLFSCSDEDSVEGTQIVNKSISNSLEMARSGNSKTPTNTSKRWDFNDLNEWDDATQAGNPNYWIDNGVLHIFTNANTWDRTKVKSVSTYAAGT